MTRCDKITIALTFAPALLAPAVLTLLPERIPTHWNLAGQADGWGGPLGLLLVFQGIMALLLGCHFIQLRMLRDRPDYAAVGRVLMAGIMGFLVLTMGFAFGLAWYASKSGAPAPWVVNGFFLGATLLLLFAFYHYAPRLFPGQPGNAAVTRRILLAVLLLFALFAAFALLAACGVKLRTDRVVLSCVGWLFVVIGNLMPKLKTNPWAGIRVKWTMEDPEIWYRTHRAAGRLWIAGGLALAVAPFFLSGGILQAAFFADLAVLTLVPILHAWRLARRKRSVSRAGRQDGPDTPRSV